MSKTVTTILKINYKILTLNNKPVKCEKMFDYDLGKTFLDHRILFLIDFQEVS